eukprot:COSAG01_NODE_1405_length_10451_cov_8.718998_4_plen_182_part_00
MGPAAAAVCARSTAAPRTTHHAAAVSGRQARARALSAPPETPCSAPPLLYCATRKGDPLTCRRVLVAVGGCEVPAAHVAHAPRLRQHADVWLRLSQPVCGGVSPQRAVCASPLACDRGWQEQHHHHKQHSDEHWLDHQAVAHWRRSHQRPRPAGRATAGGYDTLASNKQAASRCDAPRGLF